MTKTLFALAFTILVGAVALAALPKLPGPLPLPQGGDSPGVVTFNHESHVDAARPDCTTCHPTTFPILEQTKRAAVTHERMTQGRQCGACHGRTAFGFDDDCTLCHRS